MDYPLTSMIFGWYARHGAAARTIGAVAKCPRLSRPKRHCITLWQQQRASRTFSLMATQNPRDGPAWSQRFPWIPAGREEELLRYPTTTAKELRTRQKRPKRVKMLTREFIEDSLYNPHYGYFPQNVTIFNPGEPFDFNSMRDNLAFMGKLGESYTAFEDALDAEKPNDARQMWHTPTELFAPYYGEAIARYLLSNYLVSLYPYNDLIIYEMGAGRGTMMLNILDYLRDVEPDIYKRTRYRIIEISSSLADLQKQQLAAAHKGHASRVEIINCSVFDWNEYVSSPCFFLVLEVLDNFTHDCVRYDLDSGKPYQSHTVIDNENRFYEYYKQGLDRAAARYMAVREAATGGRHAKPYAQNRWLRLWSREPSFENNMSQPEYIPTRMLEFFDILAEKFPAHRLVVADFHSLPDACKGLNAPVVQTRYRRRTIPVTTPLVHQGYFDILFPTDFGVMNSVYQAVTGKFTKVMSHEDFMMRWADLRDTRVRSGENPMANWYKNASIMITL